MTFIQFALHYLYEGGLFEEEATGVMELVKTHEIMEPMKNRLNDKMESYPPMMQTIFTLSLNQVATEWIEQNCPMHVAKAMFT